MSVGARLNWTALVLVTVTGLASSLVVLGLAGAAPAARARLAAEPPCSLARSVGEVVKWKSKLKVGRRTVDRRSLRRGDRVRTNRRGKAQLCVQDGRWRCIVSKNTEVLVRPRGTNYVLQLVDGRLDCSANPNDEQQIRAKNALLTVEGKVVSRTRDIRASGRSMEAATGGDLLSLVASRTQTVAKVSRGAAILARPDSAAREVVIAKREQAAVRAGGDPQSPTEIQLTRSERQDLARLERRLPPETDPDPPPLNIVSEPRIRWSIRTATFVFRADEPALFSCALDVREFRRCESSQTFPQLVPGSHTFFVRATDAAGNTEEVQRIWVVDNSRIAFASQRDGNPEIYRIEPDATVLTRLTTDVDVLQSDENPDWAPGHERVAFDKLKGGNLDIYAINADGRGEIRLTSHRAPDRNASWSPDGTKVAFESYRDGNRDIYVMSASGTERDVVRLTNDPGEDLDPTWAPDSRSIAFASNRTGGYDIYVMRVDLVGRPEQLTHDDFADIGPSWSPDGTRIAFHSNRALVDNEIFLVNVDGGTPTRVTRNELPDENPSWAPDAVHIVFQSGRRDATQLIVVNADTGADRIELTPPGRDYVPDW